MKRVLRHTRCLHVDIRTRVAEAALHAQQVVITNIFAFVTLIAIADSFAPREDRIH